MLTNDEFYCRITAEDLNLYRSFKKVSRPWYTNYKLTCAFLNKISVRYEDKEKLKTVLDYLTVKLWAKNENYLKGVRS